MRKFVRDRAGCLGYGVPNLYHYTQSVGSTSGGRQNDPAWILDGLWPEARYIFKEKYIKHGTLSPIEEIFSQTEGIFSFGLDERMKYLYGEGELDRINDADEFIRLLKAGSSDTDDPAILAKEEDKVRTWKACVRAQLAKIATASESSASSSSTSSSSAAASGARRVRGRPEVTATRRPPLRPAASESSSLSTSVGIKSARPDS